MPDIGPQGGFLSGFDMFDGRDGAWIGDVGQEDR